MSELRANTDIMRNGATSIANGGNLAGQAASKLGSLSNGVSGAYEGQLREKLAPVLSGVSSEGSRLQNQSQETSNILFGKAAEIDEVMQRNIGLLAVSTALTIGSPTRFFFTRVLVRFGIVSSILQFIGIKTDRVFFTNIDQEVAPTTTSVLPPPISITEKKDYRGFASTVPADDKRRTLKEVSNPDKNSDAVALYYRGNGSSASNCTWYAASAVEKAHGIPLNSGKYGETGTFSTSLGNGGEWADHAQAAIDENHPFHNKYKQYQQYISSVDAHPMAGTVYSTPGTKGNPAGHVMFVDEANLVEINGEKKWQLVMSEEIYGGNNAYSGATKVEISDHPEVKRWTRTITLPVTDSGGAETDGRFIHFVDQSN